MSLMHYVNNVNLLAIASTYCTYSQWDDQAEFA